MPAKDGVVRVKGGVDITVTGPEIDGFSNEVYDAIFAEGLKSFLAKGMAKISKDDKEGIEKKAQENLENLKAGKLKASRARKAKGVSGVVMTEARRLALNWFKAECRRQGVKFAHVDAKDRAEILAARLEGPEGPALIAQAEANLELAGRKTEGEAAIVIPTSERKIALANEKANRAAEQKEAKAPKKLTPGAIPQKVGQRPGARA